MKRYGGAPPRAPFVRRVARGLTGRAGSRSRSLESKQTILQEEVAAIHYTLLLVDMSGSVVDSGDMPTLMQAASSFADRVGPYQKVAVYTFDGSPHLTPLVGFGGNARVGVINALATRRPRDPSTNLNGGVIEGVRALSQQMEHAPVPLRFGTLVVFTDGTDRAHRASPEDVARALDGAGFETYVIGVGQEVDRGQLSKIGRSGTFASQNRADVQKGFDEIAARIEASSRRYYLLSYCSPSRAGEHDVEVEAVAHGASLGRLRYRFDANGFGPTCDPNQAAGLRRPPPRVPRRGCGGALARSCPAEPRVSGGTEYARRCDLFGPRLESEALDQRLPRGNRTRPTSGLNHLSDRKLTEAESFEWIPTGASMARAARWCRSSGCPQPRWRETDLPRC